MPKKSYVNFDGKNVIFEDFLVKRIQSASLSGNFDSEEIQELGNKGFVASVKAGESYDISLDMFDRGNVDFLMHLCGKNVNGNTGQVNERDLSNVFIDGIFQTETSDGELDRVDYIPNMTLTALSMNFSVDGNANENYTFEAGKRIVFANDYKNARVVRGSYITDETFSIPVKSSGEMTFIGEELGVGDGEEVSFSLANTDVKASTYTIYLDGSALTEGEEEDYTINLLTGEVVLSTAPDIAEVLTADYEIEGAEALYLRINNRIIEEADYSVDGNIVTLLNDITIDEGDRVTYVYAPKSSGEGFEELVADMSETAVLRKGQIDIYFYREGESEKKQLRIQSVDVNVSFDKTPLEELSNEEPYDYSVTSRTIDMSINLNQSDIEMIAKATGKHAEYLAGTLNEVDFSDMVNDLVLKVKVYNSASLKDASTLLREIEVTKVQIQNPSETNNVGAVAEESYSAIADNIKITGGGNL